MCVLKKMCVGQHDDIRHFRRPLFKLKITEKDEIQ
jgi:hypothetical protein